MANNITTSGDAQVRDEGQSKILNIEDLPLGQVYPDADRASAVKLCELFFEVTDILPHGVRVEIQLRLRNGEFHHTRDSLDNIRRHPIWLFRERAEATPRTTLEGYHTASAIWFIWCGVYLEGREALVRVYEGQTRLTDRYNWLVANGVHSDDDDDDALTQMFGGLSILD
ncbi:hypothetical protein FSARC_1049 [Fusarium sarcochroum]|uniref:Uncharacterized protein n=1 Tax=Fusarium sarcochroum TaxID=1208366 RepID=A0A8H4U9Q8_9HYPO|nr:hypothetical protein FSARC_1049 [Fusarium sarcochroum]